MITQPLSTATGQAAASGGSPRRGRMGGRGRAAGTADAAGCSPAATGGQGATMADDDGRRAQRTEAARRPQCEHGERRAAFRLRALAVVVVAWAVLIAVAWVLVSLLFMVVGCCSPSAPAWPWCQSVTPSRWTATPTITPSRTPTPTAAPVVIANNGTTPTPTQTASPDCNSDAAERRIG